MIKLDEKDIKAVGRARFIRQNDKAFSLVLIGFLLIFFGLLFYLGDKDFKFQFILLVPVLGMLGYCIWYFRSLGKAEKALLKQWKEESHIV